MNERTYVSSKQSKNKFMKTSLILIPGIVLGCFFSLALLAIQNRKLPGGSFEPHTLSDFEVARQVELFHLRREFGNSVWPGWGDAELPAIAYNESHAFLLA